MAVGAHRLFRYRIAFPGETVPEVGDFLRSATSKPVEQWATYRILRVELVRDAEEPWCNGGHEDDVVIPEGMVVRVMRFKIAAVRVPPEERPADAMTWDMRADKRNHRH